MTADVDRAESDVPELDGTIEVGHMRSGSDHDVYGGRASGEGVRHMGNTEPPVRGWLGNPYQMDDDTVEERRRVIAAYLRDFLEHLEADDCFREAVLGLRGQRVACWCRGVTQERTPSTWCHLDVVACWLEGDLAPVFAYLNGDTDQ